MSRELIVGKEETRGDGVGSNQALRSMGSLMSNDEFRSFFRQHFNNWNDITILIMCMKLYDMIDQFYTKKEINLQSNDIVEIVKNAIKDSNIRRVLVDHMMKFTQGVESGFSQNFSAIEEMSHQYILDKEGK